MSKTRKKRKINRWDKERKRGRDRRLGALGFPLLEDLGLHCSDGAQQRSRSWCTRRDVGGKIRCQPFRADEGPRRTGQVLARAGLAAQAPFIVRFSEVEPSKTGS